MLSKKEGKLAFTDDKINANSKKQISYLVPLPKMDNICCHYAYEQTDPCCSVTMLIHKQILFVLSLFESEMKEGTSHTFYICCMLPATPFCGM